MEQGNAEQIAAADRAAIPVYRGALSSLAARLLSFGVRRRGQPVATIDRKRLKALESRLGTKLPSAFIATLAEREPIREGSVAIVTPDRIWDIRTSFGLDDGDSCDQLDWVYELVGDVLPPGALPFAADWGDNFYCIMLTGPQVGQVVYWDHERDEGDYSVEPIADTVASFYARLAPDPRE